MCPASPCEEHVRPPVQTGVASGAASCVRGQTFGARTKTAVPRRHAVVPRTLGLASETTAPLALRATWTVPGPGRCWRSHLPRLAPRPRCMAPHCKGTNDTNQKQNTHTQQTKQHGEVPCIARRRAHNQWPACSCVTRHDTTHHDATYVTPLALCSRSSFICLAHASARRRASASLAATRRACAKCSRRAAAISSSVGGGT